MNLFNISAAPRVLIAEFTRGEHLAYLHPSIQRTLDIEQGVAIPALSALRDKFEGLDHIPKDHPLFSKAVKLYLELEIISRSPSSFQWIREREDPRPQNGCVQS